MSATDRALQRVAKYLEVRRHMPDQGNVIGTVVSKAGEGNLLSSDLNTIVKALLSERDKSARLIAQLR